MKKRSTISMLALKWFGSWPLRENSTRRYRLFDSSSGFLRRGCRIDRPTSPTCETLS
jgi:hypothetical protein